MPEPLECMARTIRGLEWVVAAEIAGRLHGEILSLTRREVHFRLPRATTRLLHLRTADDVFIRCGELADLDHTRASLDRLSQKLFALDLERPLKVIQQIRPIKQPDRFDVVGSFVGKRNYNRYEIEAAAAKALENRLGRKRQSPDHRAGADLSWRIHLREDSAFVGLRLAAAPLYRRTYRAGTFRGALHPPLAAAMALLAGLSPRDAFLDPFCGSGTIVLEAALLENLIRPLACDLDGAATARTWRAAARLPGPVQVLRADAGRLPLAYRVADRIATNFPWGRTVAAAGVLRQEAQAHWEEIRRVTHSQSRIVVLDSEPETQGDKEPPQGFVHTLGCRIRLRGHPAVLSVFTPDSHADPASIDPWGLWGDELTTALSRWSAHPEPDP